ncbi:MAG: glycosyltransferase [Myxococcales bacterium]|nr:glycosyltransferase [Myxococcales bacterium]
MRILTVIERMGAGGTEHQLAYILPELLRRGHTADVVALFHPVHAEGAAALERSLVQAGIGVFGLGLHHRLAAPEGAAKLAALIRRRGYDVVHAKLFYSEVYTALSAPLAPEPTRVVSFHNLAYEYPLRAKRARTKVHAGLLRACQRFAAVSHAAAESHQRALGLARVDVIPNAIPTEEVRPDLGLDREAVLAPYGIEPDETVILLPARPNPEKGHRFLIEALGMLRARGLMPSALMIGTGPEVEDIRARIAGARLGNQVTFFAEEVPHAELLRLMQAVDIACLPSLFEGFPNAGAECMAMELPLVGSAVGGLLDLIEEGVTGHLVPVGDVPALAHALETLLDAPERRVRFGGAGRQRVETLFSVEHVADQWGAFYAEALAQERRSA